MSIHPIVVRNLRQLALAPFTAIVLLVGCGRNADTQPPSHLVVVSYGTGAWEESHKKAFFEPFTHITGIPIESVTWKADYGNLKTDVDTKNVKWDVVEVTAAQLVRGKLDRLYEPLSLGLNSNDFVVGAIDNYGIANVYWSTVLAYIPSTFEESPPSSWSDFWNIKKYPGPRALYDDPRCNLEFALLADGVDPSKLYPLDIARAFASLDRLKPNIRVWWDDGSQPIQLLTSKQVVMSTGWNGRFFAAKQDSPQIRWTWNGAAHDVDYWVIPKGTQRKSIAERFIWFASQPYSLAMQTELVGYGPANIRAIDFIQREIRQELPTLRINYAQGFLVNSQWWSENEATVTKQWVKWKLK